MSKSRRNSAFRDRIASDTARQKSRGSQFSYLELPEGIQQFNEKPASRIELDLLPYEVTDQHHPDRNDDDGVAIKGELWYKRPFKVHRNVGAGDQSRTIVCPTSIGEPCPICEYRAERRKDGASQEELKGMNYSYRNLYIVVPVNVGEYDRWYKDLKEGEIYIWDIAHSNFQKQLNEDIQEDPDLGVFPDLEEGLTLKLRFSAEEIFKTEYAKTSKITYLGRDPYKESTLDKVPNLDEILKVLPYKEIDALFLHGEEPTREEEEEREPKRERREHRSAREEKEEPENGGSERRERKREKKERREEEKGKCPHGYTFGKDYDKNVECDACKVWEPCSEAHDEE